MSFSLKGDDASVTSVIFTPSRVGSRTMPKGGRALFWTTREEADCTRTDKLAAVSSSNFTVLSLNTGGFVEVSFEVVVVVVVVASSSFDDFPRSNLSNELNSLLLLLLLFVLSSSSPLAAADNKRRRRRRRRHRVREGTTRAGEQKRVDVDAIFFSQTHQERKKKWSDRDQKKAQKYLFGRQKAPI